MSDRKTITLDEDTFVRMKAKQVWAIFVAVIIGTIYFVAVMYKLNDTDKKINWLYTRLKIDNPFTGDVRENPPASSASASVAPTH